MPFNRMPLQSDLPQISNHLLILPIIMVMIFHGFEMLLVCLLSIPVPFFQKWFFLLFPKNCTKWERNLRSIHQRPAIYFRILIQQCWLTLFACNPKCLWSGSLSELQSNIIWQFRHPIWEEQQRNQFKFHLGLAWYLSFGETISAWQHYLVLWQQQILRNLYMIFFAKNGITRVHKFIHKST